MNTNQTTNICKPWEITNQPKTNNLVERYQQELLHIAGANVNVFKLLGIYEQTLLIDLATNGTAISGGNQPTSIAMNAFTKIKNQWESKQFGYEVVNYAYIGYDFGVIKLPNGRNRYGIEPSITHCITTIKIKQGSLPNNRITKARVERSDDNNQWYGVAIINIPDNDQLNEINFKQTTPSRYWRIRPTQFNGGDCDFWVVQALELHEFVATDRSNIQDDILLENRDRNYSNTEITLKCYYDIQSPMMDFTRFGVELPQLSYVIRLNFNNCVSLIGRPIVIGDIIELPSEMQYTPDLRPIKKYLEVGDVAWDSTSFTPGWQPTMLSITASPALASQETQDIFGDLSSTNENSDLFNNWQDYSNVTDSIAKKSKQKVPERGDDSNSVIRQLEQAMLDSANSVGLQSNVEKMTLNPNKLYVECALPPNNLPYTEGPAYPTNPTNGDYHRLTYEGLAKDVPPRLYRWSNVKSRWIYLETDKRYEFNDQKPILDEYVTSPTKIFATEIK